MKLSLSVRVSEKFSNKREVAIPFEELAAIASASGWGALCTRPSVIGVQHGPERSREIREILDRHGLVASMATTDFSVPENTDQGPDCLRKITPHLDLAEALGADLIRVCMKSEEDIPHAASASDEAAERNIRLAHQSHMQSIFETVEGTLDVLRKIDRPNFGLIYEPSNLALCGESYGPDTLKAFAPYLFNVYLQNHVPEEDGPVPMTTWARGVVPSRLYPLDSGKGIRFEEVFEGLAAVDYNGWITLHHAFDGDLSPARAARRSVEFLRSFEA
jgi:sugar phosphate isomerase/epimerase